MNKMITQMTDLEYQFKQIMKEAVREVLQEEIEKGRLAPPPENKHNIKAPEPKQTKPRDPDSIIRPKELSKLLSVSVTSLYRWQAEGKLPEKRKFGRSVGWRYGDIQKWLGYD